MPIPAGAPALSPVSMIGRHCRRCQIPHRLRYQSAPVWGKTSPQNGITAPRRNLPVSTGRQTLCDTGQFRDLQHNVTDIVDADDHRRHKLWTRHPIALIHRQHEPSAPSASSPPAASKMDKRLTFHAVDNYS